MASKSGQVRSSGETAAQEVTEEESKNFEKPIEIELPESERKVFRTPGFSRMRLDWTSDDRAVIARAKAAVDGKILRDFSDAYQLMFDVYDLVRTPEVDEHGEVKVDQFGLKSWKRNVAGSYEEDWTRLNHKQKENFLFAITTRLFEWEQQAVDIWAEAMFAKAQWEERFSIGFDGVMGKATVDDRREAGNLDARDERYFAIFMSAYSKKADSLVSTLQLLGQRIKDSLTI